MILAFFFSLFFSFSFSKLYCHRSEKKEAIKNRKRMFVLGGLEPRTFGFIPYMLPTELQSKTSWTISFLPVLFNWSPLGYW